MSPAQHTRLVLGEYQAIGTPFTQAWASAMRTLPRRNTEYRLWKVALNWARPAFEAAYNDDAYHVLHVSNDLTELRRGGADKQIEHSRLGELTPA